MITFLRAFTFVAVILAPALILSWTDRFHLTFGLPFFVVILFAWTMVRRRFARGRVQQVSRRRSKLSINFLHEILVSAMKGAGVVALMTVYFIVINQVIKSSDVDRDRTEVVKVLTLFEANQNWVEAENLVRQRSLQPLSEEWSLDLSKRHIRYLVFISRKKPFAEAREVLCRAVELARGKKISSEWAESELRGLESVEALRLQAEEAAKNASQLKDDLTKCFRTERDAIQLKFTADSVQSRYDELLRFGGILTQYSPESAREEYRHAAELAEKHSLDQEALRTCLKQVDDLLESLRPVSLPVGSRGVLLKAHHALAPLILGADLAVTTQEGKQLAGLQAKDFIVRQENRRLSSIGISPYRTETSAWNIAILLDSSKSMSGEPMQEAKDGIEAFLHRVPAGTSLRLYSFAAGIVSRTGWTKDRDEVRSSLGTLTAEGGTALYTALSKVSADLADLPQPKAVILVTDGRDSSMSPMRAELMTLLQQGKIRWYIIGLQHGDLDATTLKKIAEATSGTYLAAGHAADLIDRLLDVSQSFQQDVYRLAIIGADPHKSISIEIGRDHPIQLTLNPAPPSS